MIFPLIVCFIMQNDGSSKVIYTSQKSIIVLAYEAGKGSKDLLNYAERKSIGSSHIIRGFVKYEKIVLCYM